MTAAPVRPSPCPVCGARLPGSARAAAYGCRFCGFARAPAREGIVDRRANLEKSLSDMPRLLTLSALSDVHVDQATGDMLAALQDAAGVTLVPLARDHRDLAAIWSDLTLPFQPDLTAFFSEKFHQLRPGGLLYLSTPVRHPLRGGISLPGQINFFRPKNIMFLLEQRGFKMAWRKNRFSPLLRIIARKG